MSNNTTHELEAARAEIHRLQASNDAMALAVSKMTLVTESMMAVVGSALQMQREMLVRAEEAEDEARKIRLAYSRSPGWQERFDAAMRRNLRADPAPAGPSDMAVYDAIANNYRQAPDGTESAAT